LLYISLKYIIFSLYISLRKKQDCAFDQKAQEPVNKGLHLLVCNIVILYLLTQK